MKERGIIFSAPMVRAILAGVKTQTRRLVKGLPPDAVNVRLVGDNLKFGSYDDASTAFGRIKCPYGAWGDRVWVRETFKLSEYKCHEEPQTEDHACAAHCEQMYVYYRATPRVGYRPTPDKARIRYLDESTPLTEWYEKGWTPAIHMFRWASRITLEITGVRVERLQDISDSDAYAEGIEELDGSLSESLLCQRAVSMDAVPTDSRVWFAELWDTINGKRAPWSSNPWVWCLTFKRLEHAEQKAVANG